MVSDSRRARASILVGGAVIVGGMWLLCPAVYEPQVVEMVAKGYALMIVMFVTEVIM